ncbi:MAG: hypothetical protein NC117_00610 [Pseudoflavonifractor sp.]|nr:hypothetical protein [Pseudoflavonifractor sp.]
MELVFVFQSVEFYVIATLVAAVVAAMALRPASRGAVSEYLVPSVLTCEGEDVPGVEAEVTADSVLRLTRKAIPAVMSTGAVSARVTVSDKDIKVEERVVFGRIPGDAVDTATFMLDFLSPGRYHLQYVSESTGMSAAMTVNIRPGYRVSRRLEC